MYQWLLGAFGALLAAARRPAPAPPPPKRPPPSFCSRKKDPEEPPAKKRKSEDIIAKLKKKAVKACFVAKLRRKALKRRKPSVSDDGSAEENYEPPAKRRRLSLLDVDIRQTGQMPCGTSGGLLKKTLRFSHQAISRLRTKQNGKQTIKSASATSVAPSLPIKQYFVPEPSTSSAITMGRPFYTVEQGVQPGENLVGIAKGRYPAIGPPPQLASFHSAQASSKVPVITYSEEPKHGVVSSVPPVTSVKIGLWRSEPPQRFSVPTVSQASPVPVQQAFAVKSRPADVSFQAWLQPGVTRLPTPAVEKKQVPASEKQQRFVPLTEAMEREVIAALSNGQADEILSSGFKLRITRDDIHSLRNQCWLNDEIINFYFRLVMERSKYEEYPSVYVFSTFFYYQLCDGGFKAVRRWTRNVDLFKQDIILVPVHMRMHWTLAVIDNRDQTIKYYDSVGRSGDTVCETLFKYLQEESRERRNLELIKSEWTLHSMTSNEIPQQTNGSDCGVFVCVYADYISRDKPMNFTQTHMPYFRRKMVWEIIHQFLL